MTKNVEYHITDTLNKTRITARGLGGTVTDMVGVIIRAVEQGLDRKEAYTLKSEWTLMNFI
ncbi:hypothetical protein [Haloquadratum walsbyi]|nr:hypothetical protein [Haloquadratum walsbyi]